MTISPPKMQDVASEAGVSMTTVSRVLQGNAIPTRETRQRVLEVVERLGYQPRRRRAGSAANTVTSPGRELRGAVAFLTGTDVAKDVHGDFDQYEKLINGMQRQFEAAGLRMYYAQWDRANPELPAVVDDPQTLGAVVMAGTESLTDGGESVRQLLRKNCPLVSLVGDDIHAPCDLALSSISDAMGASLNYLMELGHRRIVLFTNAAQGRHYLRTFYHEAARLDLRMTHTLRRLCEPVAIEDENYNQVLEDYVHRLQALGSDRPTAVILRYRYALGLVDQAQRSGWRVPEDLSVLGTTDRLLHYTHPPITAYDWPTEELGRSAAELLISRIKDPHRPYRHLAVRGRIIERASCDAPPAQ